MDDFTKEELEESHKALSSLLHKCKKSQEKLSKDTWQWNLMENNIRAIEAALPVIKPAGITDLTNDDLKTTFQTLSSTLARTEKIREKLKQGTSQWTLNKNRIRAFEIALSLIARRKQGMNVKIYEYETELLKNPEMDATYIEFPWDIKKEFGKGRVKIHAEYDGLLHDSSIVNMGVKYRDGSICYIIGVCKDIREKINKQAGDKIKVKIKISRK